MLSPIINRDVLMRVAAATKEQIENGALDGIAKTSLESTETPVQPAAGPYGTFLVRRAVLARNPPDLEAPCNNEDNGRSGSSLLHGLAWTWEGILNQSDSFS